MMEATPPHLNPRRSLAFDGFKLFLSAALLLLGGCHSPRPIQFGFYSVPKADLTAVRELGVDFVVGTKTKEYLDAAKQLNLQVIGTGSKFHNHSVLLGNYLSDEPDLLGISPAQIAIEYRNAKKKSLKPVFLNLSSGFSVEMYAPYCDVVTFDWYPIGWQPIETFYSNLRAARLASGRKPFYAIIQAFDWSRYPTLVPPSSLYRVPTPSEVKAMTIWAAMSGAKGIMFYPYRDGKTAISDTPELITAIQESIEFIRTNEEFFGQSRVWEAYPFSFEKLSDRYNEISDPSIAIKYSHAAVGKGFHRLVAANTTNREINVKPAPGFEIESVNEPIIFGPLEVKLFKIRKL